MKKHLSKIVSIAVISLLVIPQIAMASWWNPLSWIRVSIPDTKRIESTPSSIVTTPTPIVKRIIATPKPKSKPKPTSPHPTQIPVSTPIFLAPENWSALESRYFPEGDQKGWSSMTITNVNGEKRYYRKEGSSWVQKGTLAESTQTYVAPTTLPSAPTIDQLKHLFAFCAQSVAMQEYCDTKKTLNQYYSSQNFRNAMDMYIAKNEVDRATQQKNNTQTYIPPYIPSYSNPAPQFTFPSFTTPAPIPAYSPPTPVPNTFQQNDYQKKLCDSVGGIYLFGTCSIPIHG